jgi:hypothetical protein
MLPPTAFTIWVAEGLVDAAFALSPEYVATIVCVPAARALVTQLAARETVDSTTAPQLAIVAPLSVNRTVPVGEWPVTAALKATALPANDVLGVAVKRVEVVVPDDEELVVADATFE